MTPTAAVLAQPGFAGLSTNAQRDLLAREVERAARAEFAP